VGGRGVVVGGDKDLMIHGVGESKESVFPSLVQSAEDVVDREIEGANDGGGVVEGREGMEFGEGGESLFRVRVGVGWGGVVFVGIVDATASGNWVVPVTVVAVVVPLVIIARAASRRRKRRRRRRRRIRLFLLRSLLLGRPRAIPPLRRRSGTFSRATIPRSRNVHVVLLFRSKPPIRLLQGPSQIQHLPGANQNDGVAPSLSRRAGVITEDAIGEVGGGELGVEGRAEAVELAEVEGSVVQEEVPVEEVVVDAEVVDWFVGWRLELELGWRLGLEMGLGSPGAGFAGRHEFERGVIQPIGNDFDGSPERPVGVPTSN